MQSLYLPHIAEKQLHSLFFHLTQKMLLNRLTKHLIKTEECNWRLIGRTQSQENGCDIHTVAETIRINVKIIHGLFFFMRLRLLITQIFNLGILYLLLLLKKQTAMDVSRIFRCCATGRPQPFSSAAVLPTTIYYQCHLRIKCYEIMNAAQDANWNNTKETGLHTQ